MVRASWGTCAGGMVLLLLAGCSGSDFFGLNLLAVANPSGDSVVAGSVDSVSTSTQARLRQLGLSVAASKEGENVRLSTTTAKGDHFSLVLVRVQKDRGEFTKVRFEWDGSPDEQIRAHVMGNLQVQAKQ